jgi:hypothetical protein
MGARIEDQMAGIAAVEMGRLSKGAMDPVYPAMKTQEGFLEHGTVVAVPTGDPAIPDDPVSQSDRQAVKVALGPVQVGDAAHSLVSGNHRQGRPRVLSTPHVHV